MRSLAHAPSAALLIVCVCLFLTGCATADAARVSKPTSAQMEDAASKRSPLAGSVAPDFKLQDDAEQWHTLADYRGKWVVLYFYPKDDTPGCTCQATEFTGLLKSFNDMGATVVGISPDNPSMHRLFRRQYNLKITLLSDPDKTTMSRYGTWITSEVAGQKVERVVRQTFLIDPAGKIAHHWPEVIPRGHAQRVADKLAQTPVAR